MTGVDHPYEPPEDPDFSIDAAATPPAELAATLLDELNKRELLFIGRLSQPKTKS